MAQQSAHWIGFIKARYHIDFRLIPLNFGIAQFMADKDFIQQCFVTNEPYYVQKNGGHPRTLLISDSGFSPYRVIYTTQRFAREHPAEVRAFLAASLKGWDDYMNGDPSPGKALILKSNENMTQEFMDYSTKAMRDDNIVSGKPEAGERLGLMSRKRLQKQADDLANLKLISGPLAVDKFARFDLLPQAAQSGTQ
jgi:NitT/TauT family transport system substrate-binding protein